MATASIGNRQITAIPSAVQDSRRGVVRNRGIVEVTDTYRAPLGRTRRLSYVFARVSSPLQRDLGDPFNRHTQIAAVSWGQSYVR